MCLLLYLGSDRECALELAPSSVRQWFSTRHIYFVPAIGECSCAFPHVSAEEPIAYFDGIFDDDDDRDAQLAHVRKLLDLIAACLSQSNCVELYPVWNGEEASPPKGNVHVPFTELRAETFLLTEQFLYRIHRHG